MQKNPFIAGNWVRGENFFGRKELINEILEGARNYVWIAGTRRFGKTSFLKQIELLTNDGAYSKKFVSLFWDLQGSQDLDGLKDSLIESVEDAEDRFSEIGVEIDELEDSDLFTILREIKRKAKDSNLNLMLLCDEAEELINIEKNNPEVLPKLRRFFQRGDNLYVVLTATRRLSILEHSSIPNTSPFLYGFVPPVYLTRLNKEDALSMIKQWAFKDSEIEEILECTDSHPYLIQLICRRLVEACDLQKVIEEVSHDQMIGHFFSVDFQYLQAKEKEILLYLLENKALPLVALQSALDLPKGRLITILYELTQLGTVKHSNGSYAISNFFFEKWLEREKEKLFSDSALERARSNVLAVGEARPLGTLPQLGSHLAGHEILEKLGSGGMGLVFRGRDIKLDRIVALKVLLPEFLADSHFRERFIQEARAASAMNHPNIATIYQIGEEEGTYFISMEFVEGETLGGWLQSPGLTIAQKLKIAIQAAHGLAHAHQKKIIHRDVKSDNIMVTKTGEVKITDFGLAKTLHKSGSELTKTGSTLGTLSYMSPEQASGLPMDHRTDIFSFGIVLYELFTGKLPFAGEYELSVLYAIVNEDPPPMREVDPDLPERLDKIVATALQKDKESRYAEIAALAQDLQEVLEAAP